MVNEPAKMISVLISECSDEPAEMRIVAVLPLLLAKTRDVNEGSDQILGL